jgi:Carboxypeptidase regulatory-like domain
VCVQRIGKILMKHLVLILILFVTAGVAFSQTEVARLSGRVTDLSGAVILGAECTITNIETNISITTLTNEDGIYVIPGLRPATYRLSIQKKGFRTVVQPSLQLYAQDAVNQNSHSQSVPCQKASPLWAPLSA